MAFLTSHQPITKCTLYLNPGQYYYLSHGSFLKHTGRWILDKNTRSLVLVDKNERAKFRMAFWLFLVGCYLLKSLNYYNLTILHIIWHNGPVAKTILQACDWKEKERNYCYSCSSDCRLYWIAHPTYLLFLTTRHMQ